MLRPLFSLLIVLPCLVCAQENTRFVGGGSTAGVTVSTSSNFTSESGQTAHGNNTLSADGMVALKMEAARFLNQATLGATTEGIASLIASDNNFEQWINQQFGIEHTSYATAMEETYDQVALFRIEQGLTFSEDLRERMLVQAWWDKLIKDEGVLRQRLTMALGELVVVSYRSSLTQRPLSIAHYTDILSEEAFGNYGDLLQRVTTNLAMGVYLSHYNNPKSNPDLNTFPDENYAREIMQLFSIGLFELEMDGRLKLDGEGQAIPTYDNADIAGLASILTGLGTGARTDGNNPNFGQGTFNADFGVPMAMYDEQHEPGPKSFLSFETDGNLPPMEELVAAIEHLFQHPNVAPFVSQRLIQHVIKSNPTPAYVQRVATVFEDNGEGVRGDMKAIIRAILLDEEARSCTALQDFSHGKMKEPMSRYFQFVRGIELNSPDGFYYNRMSRFNTHVGQIIFFSPSVFNFYSPFHQPSGGLADNELFGPEFELHNTRTSITFPNEVWKWLNFNEVWNPQEDMINGATIEWASWDALAETPEALINELDVRFTHGTMSRPTQRIIRNAIHEIGPSGYGSDWLRQRSKMALYLTLVSPDFSILK